MLAGGCGNKRFAPVEPRPQPPSRPDAVVYLIGDAGDPFLASPVLSQLRRDVIEYAPLTEVVVVFLGDNIYESGLHPPGHPSHEQDVAALEAQLDVLRGTGAKGVFLPGNHDWGYEGERGLAQIRRQGDYLSAAAGPELDVGLVPPAGCPGPRTLRIGETVLMVLLESDLWLRDHDWSESRHCENPSLESALASLRKALDTAESEGRHALVLAHHPLRTHGPHGGYFGLEDHLFPGTRLWAPLYVPIPFLYPIVRNLGVTRQDISNPTYTRMRQQFEEVFREFPGQPLVYAAGHDHTLQVFDGRGLDVGYALVSGAGSRLYHVAAAGALFAAGKQQGECGYMRVEVYEDGRALLTVLTDGTEACDGSAGASCEGSQLRYWMWLSESPSAEETR